MFPTHLIYQAWKNTPKIIQNTRNADGEEITRELTFVDPMKHDDMEEPNGRCVLCGEHTEQGIPKKKAIGSTFTDWNRVKNISGTHICPSCFFCLTTNPKGKVAIRNFSNVAERKFHLPNRVELREWILNPPDPPFVINLAVSQKKHIVFKGETQYSRDIFHVQYEEMPVLIIRERFREMIYLVEHLLFGFTKTEISTGQYSTQRILKFGAEAWEAFEERIKPYRGTPFLDVVMFVAQRVEEEEKVACFMDLTLGMKWPPKPQLSSMPSIVAETKKEDHQESICGDKSKGLPGPVQNGPIQLELF